ncbi:MAG: hypothetical protein A2283_22310 [Lentisphaerae bacterium RIFOXYA12_FULL_48_11]|nr:MAG: hypothetical protein A2283_22310 [Lentisphaerae bacterium RIFOXYA12_FULL_48_11]
MNIQNIARNFYIGVKNDGVCAAVLSFWRYLYCKYIYTPEFQALALDHDLKRRLSHRVYEIRDSLKMTDVRAQTLRFVESMRFWDQPYGRYRYAPCQKSAVLYASTYAVLTRHLYGDLFSLTARQREEWIAYIKSFQSDDGLFRDPAVECELADTADWWGWRHLTLHAVMALTCLGAVPDKPFGILESFKNEAFIESWFKDLHITQNPSDQMNAHLPLSVVTFLQYARDFQNAVWADTAIKKIISLLDEQIDQETGCWCTGYGRKDLVNNGVKIAYHLWIFYFYDKLSIKCPDKAIDSLLSTQNAFGGFDYSINSSACDDIDSIDPLCRLTAMTDYRKSEINNALYRAVPWVLVNMNPDGGFVFKRGQSFQYGHEKMYSGVNESNMFATWFRTLSIAYIGKVLPDSWPGKFGWHFESIPGLQFWHKKDSTG